MAECINLGLIQIERHDNKKKKQQQQRNNKRNMPGKKIEGDEADENGEEERKGREREREITALLCYWTSFNPHHVLMSP